MRERVNMEVASRLEEVARLLDEQGAKMSKTKGNVIDPLEVMEEFGTDALRFSLAIM